MPDRAVLTLNAGSSSLKFAVFRMADEPVELGRGQVENLGHEARLKWAPAGGDKVVQTIGQVDHEAALNHILSFLPTACPEAQITVVGHRIVHGGTEFDHPVELNDAVIEKLRAFEKLAPLHQPFNLKAVAAARHAFPDALQVGCFDTSFHRRHDWVHDTFALPRQWYDEGVRRYGFHGLSYDYLASRLRAERPELYAGRVVMAHLGSGASMCAMHGGRSIASTMGFSAADGLPMGTRTGQIDPGVLLYLMDSEGFTPADLTRLIYKESGLLGLSGLSNDMRVLEQSDATEAAQAIAYFTTRIRHEIAGFAADLGGIDALIFSGGIGENSPRIRAECCAGMAWMGLEVDADANTAGQFQIGHGPVPVFVIATNEEQVIARAAAELAAT